MQDRRHVYEEKIMALVKQIDAICVEEGIPFTMIFQVDGEETRQSHFIPIGTNRAMRQNAEWWLLDCNPEDVARYKPIDRPV